jgi:hypothetical protein
MDTSSLKWLPYFFHFMMDVCHIGYKIKKLCKKTLILIPNYWNIFVASVKSLRFFLIFIKSLGFLSVAVKILKNLRLPWTWPWKFHVANNKIVWTLVNIFHNQNLSTFVTVCDFFLSLRPLIIKNIHKSCHGA